MSKPKSKQQLTVAKLAQLEIMLTDLERDHAAATYHLNVLVEECIKHGHDDLERVMKALLDQKNEQADILCKIAWVRINFARRLLDADSVEHLLGESKYLELSETSISSEALVSYYFVQLEQELFQLHTKLKNQSQVQ